MYTDRNFRTKKALKEAVKSGQQIRVFAPHLGKPVEDGREYLEGPWYPTPHTWYAEAEMAQGLIVSVR